MPTLLIEGRKVGICDITYNRNDDSWNIHNIQPPGLKKSLIHVAIDHIRYENEPRRVPGRF